LQANYKQKLLVHVHVLSNDGKRIRGAGEQRTQRTAEPWARPAIPAQEGKAPLGFKQFASPHYQKRGRTPGGGHEDGLEQADAGAGRGSGWARQHATPGRCRGQRGRMHSSRPEGAWPRRRPLHAPSSSGRGRGCRVSRCDSAERVGALRSRRSRVGVPPAYSALACSRGKG
jgi:hypothetical protein